MAIKWFPGLSKSGFRKHLLVFFVVILMTTGLFLSINLVNTSHSITKELETEASGQLARVGRNLDLLLDNIDQTAFQVSLSIPATTILNSPFDAEEYDMYQLKEQMRGWSFANPLIDSFYLYIYQNNKVLTSGDGLYAFPEFYDRDFLGDMKRQNNDPSHSWTGLRGQPKSGASNSNDGWVTFARAVPFTHKAPLGMLAINIDKEILLRAITSYTVGETEPVFLLDPQGQVVADSSMLTAATLIVKHVQRGGEHTSIAHVGDKRYFVTAYSLPVGGWTVIQTTPYEKYSRQMAEAARKVLIIFLLSMAVGLVVSYLLASMLYGPWKRLSSKLQSYATKLPGVATGDDYKDIDSAIGHLITTIRHNEPIVRGNLVLDLIHNYSSEEQNVIERFAQLGVKFHGSNFIVMVIASERPESTEGDDSKQNLIVFSLAEDILQGEHPAAGAILERNKFVFLLGVQHEELDAAQTDKLEKIGEHIIQQAKTSLNVALVICIGGLRPLQRVHEAYEQAQRTMAYKAFRAHTDVLFAEDNEQPLQFDYPASYQKLLLNLILACDRSQTEALLTELFDKYIDNGAYSQPKLQLMITMLISYVLSTIAQEGYDIGPMIDKNDVLNMQSYRNSAELRTYVGSRMSAIIDYLQSLQVEKRLDARIRKAIDYMENHFSSSISIVDIAEAVGISSGHLNRLFKSEMGKSPLEHLTECRLEQGKRMLLDPSLSLAQISAAIGYIDAHSFIRLFKKYEGMTPGEYRKISM